MDTFKKSDCEEPSQNENCFIGSIRERQKYNISHTYISLAKEVFNFQPLVSVNAKINTDVILLKLLVHS